MSRNKKGVELSINTVIIIIITLFILLILIFLVMKGAGQWNKGTSCDTQGGDCVTFAGDKRCPETKPVISAYSCPDKGQTCCINIGGLGEDAK